MKPTDDRQSGTGGRRRARRSDDNDPNQQTIVDETVRVVANRATGHDAGGREWMSTSAWAAGRRREGCDALHLRMPAGGRCLDRGAGALSRGGALGGAEVCGRTGTGTRTHPTGLAAALCSSASLDQGAMPVVGDDDRKHGCTYK